MNEIMHNDFLKYSATAKHKWYLRNIMEQINFEKEIKSYFKRKSNERLIKIANYTVKIEQLNHFKHEKKHLISY